MSEFEKQNEEVFAMVHQNRACHPAGRPLTLVPKQRALELLGTEAAYNDEKKKSEAARAVHAVWVIILIASAVLVGRMM